MATIIFDFDHTLFHTNKLRDSLREMFSTHGVPKEIESESEIKHRKESNDNYGVLEHAKKIAGLGYSVPREEIEKFMEKDLESHLKGPVKQILETLKQNGHKLILLSKGIEYFQKFKIRKSGIESFFGEHIYICEDRKDLALKHIPKEEATYFINDNLKETLIVKKSFPEMHFIGIIGPKTTSEDRTRHPEIPFIEDVSKILDCIKKIQTTYRKI